METIGPIAVFANFKSQQSFVNFYATQIHACTSRKLDKHYRKDTTLYANMSDIRQSLEFLIAGYQQL